MGVMEFFKVMLVAQGFYAFAITIIVYGLTGMPNTVLDRVNTFSDLATDMDLNSTAAQLEDSLSSQTNLPLVEIGAIVFYSGNIIIDLLTNFAFAVPQLLGLLTYCLIGLLHLPAVAVAIVESFAAVLFAAIYIIGIIQLIMSFRSGQSIT